MSVYVFVSTVENKITGALKCTYVMTKVAINDGGDERV